MKLLQLESFFIGFGSAVIIGIAKESRDGRGHRTEDVNDVYADTLGGIAGSVLSAQFSWSF